MAFQFDIELSPEENINLFFEHIKGVDENLARLLQDSIYKLIPLPEPGPSRNSLRKKINSEILELLEKQSTDEEES